VRTFSRILLGTWGGRTYGGGDNEREQGRGKEEGIMRARKGKGGGDNEREARKERRRG
jgi:hypothetical protein